MITEAKRAGNARHIAKLDQIKIQPYKEEGERIRLAAAEANMPLQAYILEAVRRQMSQGAPEGADAVLPVRQVEHDPRTFRGEDQGPCKFSLRIPQSLYMEIQKTLILTKQRPEAFVLQALELYTVFKREGLSPAQVRVAAEDADQTVTEWLIDAIRDSL